MISLLADVTPLLPGLAEVQPQNAGVWINEHGAEIASWFYPVMIGFVILVVLFRAYFKLLEIRTMRSIIRRNKRSRWF